MESSLILFFFFIIFILPLSESAGVKPSNKSSTYQAGAEPSNKNSTYQAEVDTLKTIYKAWNITAQGPHVENKNPCYADQEPLQFVSCEKCSMINNISTCSITSLNVSGQNIKGEIHRALSNLTMLTHLDLSKNLLSGPVPQEISSLTNLEYLDLSINSLNGTLDVLDPLKNLTYLSFGSNNFIGRLPNLVNPNLLKKLYFDSSGVSEQFETIEKYSQLEILWAFDNPFKGTLDPVAKLKNLTELRIYGTNIEGPIPTSLKSLISLETLMIGDLHLRSPTNTETGTTNTSDSVFSFLMNMRNLTVLSLRNCSLKENVFHIPSLPKLAYLDLSSNSLFGKIPISFRANLTALEQLFLGGNNFDGELSELISSDSKLTALDVSFNNIMGDLNFFPGIHINFLGTFIRPSHLNSNENISEILTSINNSSKNHIRDFTSNDYIAIKCGGGVQNYPDISYYNDDTGSLGAADVSFDPNNLWVVGNSAFFPTNETNNYTVSAKGTISVTNVTNETYKPLYQTARISQSSLSYYIVGLPNADNYTVELHFAEIIIEDPKISWKGLGKRFFNIKVLDNETKDFNIVDEAKGGSNKAANKTYHDVKVTNGYIDIQLLWAGRGTYRIPENGTYGPLISAIYIYQGKIPPPIHQKGNQVEKSGKKRAGIVVGILSLGVASIMITASVVFLWWEWIQIGQEIKP